MGIATGLTAERMLEIEGQSIVGGYVNVDNRLILTRFNGLEIDAGDVKGDPATVLFGLATNSGLTLTGAGTIESPWVLGTAFASSSEAIAGTELYKALSPGRIFPIAMVERALIIDSTVDWNTVVLPGMYQVTSVAGAHAPSGVYGFGVLVVYTKSTRTVHQYFPHNSSISTDRYPVLRSKYSTTDWGGWMGMMPIASVAEVKAGVDNSKAATSLGVMNAIYGVPYGYAESALSWALTTSVQVVPIVSAGVQDQMTYSTSNYEFTIGVAGSYEIEGRLVYAPGASGLGAGQVLFYIQRNAALIPISTTRDTPESSNDHSIETHASTALQVGDTIRLAVARSAVLSDMSVTRAALRIRRFR